MAEGIGAPQSTVKNGRFQKQRDLGFFSKYFLKLSIYFSSDCMLQGVNVENCMYAREDKVPQVYLYFFFFSLQ